MKISHRKELEKIDGQIFAADIQLEALLDELPFDTDKKAMANALSKLNEVHETLDYIVKYGSVEAPLPEGPTVTKP